MSIEQNLHYLPIYISDDGPITMEFDNSDWDEVVEK